jgi:hypothetical protein
VPTIFVALTLNVYDVPVERPLTTTGDDAPEPVNPPGVDVAVYVYVAGEPVAEGENETLAQLLFPAVAVPIVGALGATACTEFDEALYAPYPDAF